MRSLTLYNKEIKYFNINYNGVNENGSSKILCLCVSEKHSKTLEFDRKPHGNSVVPIFAINLFVSSLFLNDVAFVWVLFLSHLTEYESLNLFHNEVSRSQ